ncbi:MAG: hypothetical protein JNJ61_12930, partial [Anaerolineae bacterium]|nr:hypothetical protein [Anaerolineae bacterium]
MRIQRNSSRLSFRRQRRRRTGCFSLAVLLGVLVGAAALSINWLGARLHFNAPGESDALSAAQGAFERGDLDGAISHARLALEANPDNEAALLLLARALVYRSYTDYNRAIDRQLALEVTSAALANNPASANLLAIHAYALQAAGQPLEAARIAEQALDRDADNTLARIALGLSYASVGSFEIALRESQQASQGDGWQIESQRAIAISSSDLGDYQGAIKAIDRALGLNRHLLPLYFERALYALQIGDTGAATAAYYQVLTYDPDNVKVRLRLCELSSLLRERDTALRYCEEVTDLAPSWSDGWYQLGMEYFLQGSFAQARDALHRCSTLQVMQNVPVSERRFECWYLQGQAAEIIGDCPNLLATYNEYRAMTADATIPQRWTYPPEGPPGCGG